MRTDALDRLSRPRSRPALCGSIDERNEMDIIGTAINLWHGFLDVIALASWFLP
ncbi:hypothetical protein KO481_16380 [Nocardia sp. NEAU-G5]|uniref:Uncharacterized protein n=1 Tax=Nocardia albiluteola TaxID=2842303 RepID=A0ABS6AZ02_9NOCA|nr:hypothetical protein [Nocardia albiluteola]MBU3063098.1 hypothetical protein [Nocardia albiluteola]